MADKHAAEALVRRFQYERTLNQDQAGRRATLYGRIDDQPALLVLERAPFPASPAYLGAVAGRLRALQNLGANDVYYWYMGGEGGTETTTETATTATETQNDNPPNLKINLIWPCTDQHVQKYSRQAVRVVTETAAVYRDRVQPWVQAQRAAGRLDWVVNILEGRREADDVLFRTHPVVAGDPAAGAHPDGFLLLPDLNWDRATVEALHLLALVERRDLASLRDLRRRHVPWLRRMRAALLAAAAAAVPAVAPDQLKLYLHYPPTYYHLHVHVVHAQLEAGATQAVGKAIGLDSLIEQLDHMRGDDDAGLHEIALTYSVGEASALWTAVFGPLREEAAQETEENAC